MRNLRNLRKELNGHYGRVAELSGKSKAYISMVLNDKKHDEEVIRIAVAVRAELRKELELSRKRIAKLLEA